MNREKEIYRVTLWGSVVNISLTAFKFVAGILGCSAAMIADAVHSLSDLLTDVVVLLFVRISSRPADSDHPYGHGKYETLASAIVAIVLIAVIVFILLRLQSARRLAKVIAQKERMESELSIARGIQMSMVPGEFPQREGLDMFASMNPAKEVGGDLYDYLLTGDKLYFCLGDVSGKGVPAA